MPPMDAYNEQFFDSVERAVGIIFLKTDRKALRDEFKKLGFRVPLWPGTTEPMRGGVWLADHCKTTGSN